MYYHVMSVLLLSLADYGVMFPLSVMIDLTVSTVLAATCLDHRLELAGNSLSVGTNVESWPAL